jgi:hypothetical protein
MGAARNLLKRRAKTGMKHYLQHGRGGDWVDHVNGMLDRVIRTGGVFQLWGHSWELDEKQQWDALDRVLERIAREAKASRVSLMTNGQLVETYRK